MFNKKFPLKNPTQLHKPGNFSNSLLNILYVSQSQVLIYTCRCFEQIQLLLSPAGRIPGFHADGPVQLLVWKLFHNFRSTFITLPHALLLELDINPAHREHSAHLTFN